MANWYLEGSPGRDQKISRTLLRSLPFAVGRRSSCDLTLASKLVSQVHAELFDRGGRLFLRDLGSTNGTFVNGEPVNSEARLDDGDVVHFADLEFRLIEVVSEHSFPSLVETERISLQDLGLGSGSFARYRQLREMLEEGQIETDFQPLVSFGDRGVLGYEVLGRGRLAGVRTSPGELFYLAEEINLTVELSTAFRIEGLRQSLLLSQRVEIFVNTHPTELQDQARLLDSLAASRRNYPELPIVLEIHESAVADLDALRELRRELTKLRVGIAFDDFGTGQARLLELTDVAPDYLKFDAAFIRNIHLATRQRHDMVATLVHLARDMGIITVAEGVEAQEEAETCAELGFEYAQGFHYGRPSLVEDWIE